MDDDDDLMGDRSAYHGIQQEYNEPTARGGDKLDIRLDNDRLLIEKLERENQMKDEAVEKASHLIELLTIDL